MNFAHFMTIIRQSPFQIMIYICMRTAQDSQYLLNKNVDSIIVLTEVLQD